MIEAWAESRPGSSSPNEDLHLVADAWALVLDGITRYPDDGCIHDVPWYVGSLAESIADRIETPLALAEVLAAAIAAVNARHAGTCDLANPVSPGATAALARWTGPDLEWLVLGDCTIAWRDLDGKCRTETDERLAGLADPPKPADVGDHRRYPVEYIARVRNREGGFWVASTDPAAAAMARTGIVPTAGIADVLLCTDGLSRLVDRYGHTWTDVIALAADRGVGAALDLVRDHGDRDPNPAGKRHDDATAVRMRFPGFASL